MKVVQVIAQVIYVSSAGLGAAKQVSLISACEDDDLCDARIQELAVRIAREFRGDPGPTAQEKAEG